MPATLALDSRVLAAAEDLPLLANTIVEGFLDGLHRSPFLGYSTEFSAYRAYTQGDNLRHIDWKVWARTDELYVKQFEDDTNLRCQIYLDTSASMDFGGTDANKFLYGRLLAAALAQLMVKQRDAPGLILFGAESRQAVPAQATRHQAIEILTLLAQTRAAGGTVIGQDLFGLVQTFTRRGLAVVISDFFTADDTVLELLRQLHAQRQEILVFQLLAPDELDLPFEGEFIMEDSETSAEVVVQADDFRAEYRRRLETFCERIRRECITLEADYQRVRTDQPLDQAMIAYLERRMAV
ncbi:MAG TPA: DUF58 domain-containing protein [Verrucomicrobiota bacterium]|nr:DUF58 domain-containing protein [Verrucomicrobiales bacterium]HRI15556.1 DUF58 domain-containing protein [Verrucomicrobiota bacterium]